MRSLDIHIGAHKTGSTALQRFLAENASEFRQRGVYIPHTGRLKKEDPGHHLLAESLLPGAETETLWDDLLSEIKGEKAVVLSSENFEHADRDKITDLSDRLRANDWMPRFIWLYRQPSDHALALDYELRKHGVHPGRIALIRQIRRLGYVRGTNGLNFWVSQSKFAAHWPTPLILISYDEVKSDIAGEFCRIIGMEPFAKARSNVRKTPEARLRKRVVFNCALAGIK